MAVSLKIKVWSDRAEDEEEGRFISCSSEADAVSADHGRWWGAERQEEVGVGWGGGGAEQEQVEGQKWQEGKKQG